MRKRSIYGGGDMGAEPDIDGEYVRLRRAAATDMRQARRDVGALIAGPPEVLAAVLELASRPGEGRVRVLIATVARVETLPDSARAELGRWLRQWAVTETDGLARPAIAAALQAIEPAASPVQPVTEFPAGFPQAYRFAAELLCHRVSQGLMMPTAMLVRLEKLAEETADVATRGEVVEIATRLRSALNRLSRTVEFDTDDAYTRWQPFVLGAWLEGASPRFASTCGPATLTLIGSDRAKRVRVRAMPLLLETTFGNLWANAVQAVEQAGLAACHITVELNAVGESLDVLLRDSGPGFPTKLVETAFRLPFSTKAETRGRGLIEVADAVARLQGTVRLVPVAANEHRVLIRVPIEKS